MSNQRRDARVSACFLLVTLLSVPRLACAIDDIYVRVTGIQGDAQDLDHKNWIQAYALGNSVAASTANGSTATLFSDVSILKNIDRASPALFVTAARGQPLNTVDIDLVRPGPERFVYFKMKLSDALITGVRTNANPTDNSITEFVTFSYARIEWEYRPQKPDGSADTPVKGCWDVTAASVC